MGAGLQYINKDYNNQLVKWDLPWSKTRVEGCAQLGKAWDWRSNIILSSLQESIWTSWWRRVLAGKGSVW